MLLRFIIAGGHGLLARARAFNCRCQLIRLSLIPADRLLPLNSRSAANYSRHYALDSTARRRAIKRSPRRSQVATNAKQEVINIALITRRLGEQCTVALG